MLSRPAIFSILLASNLIGAHAFSISNREEIQSRRKEGRSKSGQSFLAAGTNHMTDAFWSTGRDKNREEDRSYQNRVFDSVLLDSGKKGVKQIQDNNHRSNTFYDSRNYVEDGVNYGDVKKRIRKEGYRNRKDPQQYKYYSETISDQHEGKMGNWARNSNGQEDLTRKGGRTFSERQYRNYDSDNRPSSFNRRNIDDSGRSAYRRRDLSYDYPYGNAFGEEQIYYYYYDPDVDSLSLGFNSHDHHHMDDNQITDDVLMYDDEEEENTNVERAVNKKTNSFQTTKGKFEEESDSVVTDNPSEEEKTPQVSLKFDNTKITKLEKQTTNGISISGKIATTKDIEMDKKKETTKNYKEEANKDTEASSTTASTAISHSPLTESTAMSNPEVTDQGNGLNEEQEETMKERFQNQVDDYQSVKPDIIAYRSSVANISQNETKAANNTVKEITSNRQNISQKLITDVTDKTTTIEGSDDVSKLVTAFDTTTQSSEEKSKIQDIEKSQDNKTSEFSNDSHSTPIPTSTDNKDTNKTITSPKLQIVNTSSDLQELGAGENHEPLVIKKITGEVEEKAGDINKKPDTFRNLKKNDIQETKSINGVAAATTSRTTKNATPSLDLKNTIDTQDRENNNVNPTRKQNSTAKPIDSPEKLTSIIKNDEADYVHGILTTTQFLLTNTTENKSSTSINNTDVSNSSTTENFKTSTLPTQDSQNSKELSSAEADSVHQNSDLKEPMAHKSNNTLENTDVPFNKSQIDISALPSTISTPLGMNSTSPPTLDNKPTSMANTNSSAHENPVVRNNSVNISHTNISRWNTTEQRDNIDENSRNGENGISDNSSNKTIHRNVKTTSEPTVKNSTNKTDNTKRDYITIDRDTVLNQTATHSSTPETQENASDPSALPPKKASKPRPVDSSDGEGINSPASTSQEVNMRISLNTTRDTQAKHSANLSGKVDSETTTTRASKVLDKNAGSGDIQNTSLQLETNSAYHTVATEKTILNSSKTIETNQQDTSTNATISTYQSTQMYEISTRKHPVPAENVSQGNESTTQNDKPVESSKTDIIESSDELQSSKEKELISKNSTESTSVHEETKPSDPSENENNFNHDKNRTNDNTNATTPTVADEKEENVNVKEHNTSTSSPKKELLTDDIPSSSTSNKTIVVSAAASLSKSDIQHEENQKIHSLRPTTSVSSTQKAQGISDMSDKTEINGSQADIKLANTEATQQPQHSGKKTNGSTGHAVEPFSSSTTNQKTKSLKSILSSEPIDTNTSTHNKTLSHNLSPDQNKSSSAEPSHQKETLVSNETSSTHIPFTFVNRTTHSSLGDKTVETNSSDLNQKGKSGASERKDISVDSKNESSSRGIPSSSENLNDTEYEEIEIPETSAYMIQDFSLRRDEYLKPDTVQKADTDTVDLDPQTNETAKDCPPSGPSAPCPPVPPPTPPRSQAAMSAVLTSHFGPTKEQIIPFDLELLDLADNYDNTTGMFICTIPGTYVISLYLMSHPGAKVNARVFINNRPVAALWADDAKNAGFYPSSSIQTIVQLGFGDQVYVMLVDGGYGDSWVHANYNVFTVFLLYEQVFK